MSFSHSHVLISADVCLLVFQCHQVNKFKRGEESDLRSNSSSGVVALRRVQWIPA